MERALAVPGTAVKVWYEPTLPLPDATPQLWQLRVVSVQLPPFET